jgi:hypothetical protein
LNRAAQAGELSQAAEPGNSFGGGDEFADAGERSRTLSE